MQQEKDKLYEKPQQEKDKLQKHMQQEKDKLYYKLSEEVKKQKDFELKALNLKKSLVR
jgi:hypothetical protein